MIPRIIHYCWFGGGEMPELLQSCIASWRKYCPEYTINRWDETNSPVEIPFVREALKHRKYAFAADYTRFYVLYHEGGIYLDTDMLMVKSLDVLLLSPITRFLGREDAWNVSMGIIGAEAGDVFCKQCMDIYDDIKFDMVSPPIITRLITPILIRRGLVQNDTNQLLSDGTQIFESKYFYPIHYSDNYDINKISSYISPKTYCVHLWAGSWSDEMHLLSKGCYRQGFTQALQRIRRTPILPVRYYAKLSKYFYYYVLAKLKSVWS